MEHTRHTIILNLQLFAEEKTENATPKKKREAREKGQILKSVELNSALILLAAFGVLFAFMPYISEQIGNFMVTLFRNPLGFAVTHGGMNSLAFLTISTMGKVILPFMLIVMVVGILANYIQVGPLFTTEPLKFKPERLNPLEGLKRMFSKRSVVELVKSLFKVFLIGYIAFRIVKKEFINLPLLQDMSIFTGVQYVGKISYRIAIVSGILLLFLAVFDYAFQWYEYEKNLKMSKKEIKDEYKQSEGDPLIKSKIKERQRAMAMQRMMQSVPEADVIITNPTHLAIALKYDIDSMEAPTVIAKGQDMMAQRIKEVGRNHEVSIFENKPLARSLYKSVEIGQAIPASLYQAVAEVLAFVYQLKQKKA